ncbi:MAG TPA: TIGR03435 family protein [Acidobacteriaceae bacterium]|nr:TIGR03435 family protein [Acidobacteriaceae bacterium]
MSTAGAQSAGSSVTTPRMMPKGANPDWDVASVKKSDPRDKSDNIDIRGRHVIVENETIKYLLTFAYGVDKSQIEGTPDWVGQEHYDVDGLPNVEGQPNLKQTQALLQKLLAERFGLKLHHEQKNLPAFALMVAKGGPKFVKSKGDPDGIPDVDGGGDDRGRQFSRFTNEAMSDLPLFLMTYVGRPVVDRTGLSGRYDFELKWSLDELRATQPDAPPGIFTALEEQAGLKLERVTAPVDVLVVDGVERPSAN